MTSLLAASAWDFEFHPEVWLLVAAIIGLGVYSVRNIGPLAVPAGEPVTTVNQKRFFIVGVAMLWLAADWPMHDIAEEHLYFVHMLQHLLISFIIPPLLLLAMPAWLARLVILDDGTPQRILRVLTKPIVAGTIFNAVQILTHWGAVVNLSSDNGPFHYTIHLLVFASALLMWFPVVGPLKELQMGEPGKMLYLFLMSIVPTVPAGWLTFAEGVVYEAYETDDALWGISPVEDQQAAGAVMKVIGGFYLWTIIAVRFFRLAANNARAEEQARRDRHNRRLTFDDVEQRFADAGEPPVEPR